jgi:hypothetical protein
MSYVPKDLILVQIGRFSASLYPKIEPSMPVFERAHAFQVAKSTLEALPADTRLLLDAIGNQLNCSTIINGLMHDWCGLFDATWFDFQNLAIALFHDPVSALINNTTVAANPALLLPVVDYPLNLCCQQNVRFMHITCTIDFCGLISVPTYGPTMLRNGFYLEILQITVAMVNGNNVAYNLTTWHGVTNLSALSSEEVCL